MKCVDFTIDGYLVEIPTPDDLNDCSYVLYAPHENSIKVLPFYMDVQTAIAISLAIVSVWAVAFGFQYLSKQIDRS